MAPTTHPNMINDMISVFITGTLQGCDYRRSQTDQSRRNPRAAEEATKPTQAVGVLVPDRQVSSLLKETERVWYFNHAHPGRALLVDDLIAQGLYSRPVHLRPEMMFGVVTVTKPSP